MTVDWANLRTIAGRSAVAVTALQTVTATLGQRASRRDYADAAWGPGLAGIALISAASGTGDAPRRWATAALTGAWAVRLEKLMAGRLRGSDEEDPRYADFIEGDSPATVVSKVFVTQGLAQLLVSVPVQLAAASTVPRSARRWLVPIGLGIGATGAIIEAVADRQKAAYMARDRDERPDVLDTGLWGVTRHPNYFGDSLMWDGVWVASAASPGALFTLPAPAAMTYFLMFATGAKRTEDHMAERPGYRDYQERVAFFFPWVKRS